MPDQSKLDLPESHYNILRLVSAMAWADGDLSEEESEILINQFNSDLPPNPNPLLYLEDAPPFFSSLNENPLVAEQLSERINAESALKKIMVDYKYNPIPLNDLVSKIKTQEDRCLALKLAYMIIKASADENGELINNEEKKAYRQLINLLNLKPDLIKEIELQANKDLEKFKHPLQAFLSNVKNLLDMTL